MRAQFALIVALLLGGCAATGPIYQPASEPGNDQALVYLYRPGSHYLGARTAHFEVDGKHVAELKNNGYTVLHLTPGPHTISQRWTKLPFDDGDLPKPFLLEVSLPPGSTRYVRLEASHIPNYITWRLTEEAGPSRALAKCKYSPPH